MLKKIFNINNTTVSNLNYKIFLKYKNTILLNMMDAPG